MDKDTQGKTNQIEKILSLVELVEYLRSPHGCKWDMEQTHQSLRNNLIEETYELLDAIEENSSEKIKEELGDILMQVLYHSDIASDNSKFDFFELCEYVRFKLINRHPHVFKSKKNKMTSSDVVDNWEEIKKDEKLKNNKDYSLVSDIPDTLPSLSYATSVIKKSKKAKIPVKYEELDFNIDAKIFDSEERLGKILFSLVNLFASKNINQELVLRNYTKKIKKKILIMEKLSKDKSISELSQIQKEKMWSSINC